MSKELKYDSIQEWLVSKYDEKTDVKLSDYSLESEFVEAPSTKKEIEKLNSYLKTKLWDKVSKSEIKKISVGYSKNLVKPGTKGVIRGVKLNNIVKTEINLLFKSDDNYCVGFEKEIEGVETDEIPDFYVTDKRTGKTVVGYNQVDLWSGGAQKNRGNKYLSIVNESLIYCIVISKKWDLKVNPGKKMKDFLDILIRIRDNENIELVYVSELENTLNLIFPDLKNKEKAGEG